MMVADWREDYNHRRPHSALGMTAPASFARAWADDHSAAVPLRSPSGLTPRDGDPTTPRPRTTHHLSQQVGR